MKYAHQFFLIISGPTGVGKTAFVDQLARQLDGQVEIINADMGQLYAPLSIGTAKPTHQERWVPHHLFDIINEPRVFTAFEYRNRVITCLQEVWQRKRLPILVGGSGFYLKSLFFPPIDPQLVDNNVSSDLEKQLEGLSRQELWELLNDRDPVRASQLHPNDRYRVTRALALLARNRMPSEFKPTFACPGRCAIVFLTRERQELYHRINARVDSMFAQGWVDEVRQLSSLDTPDQRWFDFLQKKKIIGYPEIIDFIDKHSKLASSNNYAALRDLIAMKTRAYAKRQLTFWRSFREQLVQHDHEQSCVNVISEYNLTESSVDAYVHMLEEKLERVARCMQIEQVD